MKKLLFILALAFSITVSAKPKEDVVTLVVTGEGKTEQEAVVSALRTAIEQAFGCFISSNTTILNDELVSDEIVSVGTGNVKQYKKLSSGTLSSGSSSVTLEATISLGKLSDYTVSKGASIEFDGQSVANNLRAQRMLDKINLENEIVAMTTLCQQLYTLLPDVFDYDLSIISSGVSEKVSGKVLVKKNSTTDLFVESISNTLSALSVGKDSDKSAVEVYFAGNTYYLRSCEWAFFMKDVFSSLNERAWGWRITSQDPEQVFYSISSKHDYPYCGLGGMTDYKHLTEVSMSITGNDGGIWKKIKYNKQESNVLFSHDFSISFTDEQLDNLREIAIHASPYLGTVLCTPKRESEWISSGKTVYSDGSAPYYEAFDGDIKPLLAKFITKGIYASVGNLRCGFLDESPLFGPRAFQNLVLDECYKKPTVKKAKGGIMVRIEATTQITLRSDGQISIRLDECSIKTWLDYTGNGYKPIKLDDIQPIVTDYISNKLEQFTYTIPLTAFIDGRKVFPGVVAFKDITIPGPSLYCNLAEERISYSPPQFSWEPDAESVLKAVSQAFE